MADYVVAQHYTPHITVPIEVLAQIYLDEGARTGVRGDVAFAQSILETGGFANPGSAATDNNFAGIGWCDTCKHGFDFPDAKTGVRAQLQLLRIYVDPTFPDATYKDKILLPGTLTLGFRGKVQTWWDLWGTWATGALYGQRVYDIYERMVAFAAFDPTPPPGAAKPAGGASARAAGRGATEALRPYEPDRQAADAGVLVAPRPLDRDRCSSMRRTRARSSSSTTRISSRARFAPRQWCTP